MVIVDEKDGQSCAKCDTCGTRSAWFLGTGKAVRPALELWIDKHSCPARSLWCA